MVRHLKYCQDPIKKHKKRITINLRKVTDTLAEKCDGRLKKRLIVVCELLENYNEKPNHT